MEEQQKVNEIKCQFIKYREQKLEAIAKNN
jgi:hypothetical protein